MAAQDRTARPHRTAPLAVLVAPLLLSAGCGGPDGAAAADTPTSSSPAAGSTPDLQGTWRTEDIPLERLRANFLAAGGTEEQADDFLATGDGRNTWAFVIQIGDDDWVELESDDGRTPVTGWRGTYTLEADGVHAHELGGACTQVYAPSFDDQGRMSIEVVSDEGSDPGCSTVDLFAQKTIYESAPFTRTP